MKYVLILLFVSFSLYTMEEKKSSNVLTRKNTLIQPKQHSPAFEIETDENHNKKVT